MPISTDSRAGGHWTALPGWGQADWLGYPLIRDSKEHWLLERPLLRGPGGREKFVFGVPAQLWSKG